MRRPGAAPLDVRRGLLRHASHVTGRGGAPLRLVLRVDGHEEHPNRPLDFDDSDEVLVSAPLAGRGFRGVVGLSRAPRVELFHEGLRVVQGSSLQALLPERHGGPRRGLGLALKVDVDRLRVLVDRRTVAQDDTLRAVVDAAITAARRLERRLERRLLHDVAPLPPWRALLARVGRVLASWPARALGIAALSIVVGAALGLGGVLALRPDLRPGAPRPVPGPGHAPTTSGAGVARARGLDGTRAHFDRPRIDVRGAPDPGWDVVTSGVGDAWLRLFVLPLADDDRGLRPRAPDTPRVALSSPPSSSPAGALGLRVDAAGLLAVPHDGERWPARVLRLDPAQEDAPGEPLPLPVDVDGMPHVALDGPAFFKVELARHPSALGIDPPLASTPTLAALVAPLLPLPPSARVDAVVALVQRRVAYAADAVSADLFARDPRPLVERALALGRGDCDVINTVLVRAFLQAGLAARLAVGLVVDDDEVAPELHAWGEVRLTPGGPWIVMDASPPEARPRPTPAAPATTATAHGSVPTATAAATPPQTSVQPVPRAALPRTAASSAAVLLAVVCGGGVVIVAAARRGRRRGPLPTGLLPLFGAGLSSGAAEPLGLAHRPVLATHEGRRVSRRDAHRLHRRGRLARGARRSPWVAKDVVTLDVEDAFVRGLAAWLPPVVNTDALTLAPRGAGLPRLQALVDDALLGVALGRHPRAGIRELHLHAADGTSHQILVGPDIGDDDDAFRCCCDTRARCAPFGPGAPDELRRVRR